MYLLQSLQRYLSATLKFVFSWKICSDLVSLISQGTISPILGQGKIYFLFPSVSLYLQSWIVSVQSEKISISVAKIYRFLSWNSIVHSPTIRHPNERAIKKLRCYESILENTFVSSGSCSCILLQELGTFYMLSL